MRLITLSLVIIICSNAVVGGSIAPTNNCSTMLKDAGASDHFAGSVAHCVHSLSIQSLRIFEPTSSAIYNNSIPTINMDLTADDAILLYAPDRPSAPFVTDAMRIVDSVLTHMDDAHYDVRFYSTLERLVHAFHMNDVWTMAKRDYDALRQRPPTADACRCALDINGNGIIDQLRIMALKIREPQLVYGGSGKEYYSNYQHGRRRKRQAEENRFIENSFIHKNMLLTAADAGAKLIDAAAWAKWRRTTLEMPKVVMSDLALYLYCELNKH